MTNSMNQSESINELAASLSKAQGEMQAAIKDKQNPFFKSCYADLGSVWDAARPVLCKYGLCVMQTTELAGDKIIMVTTLAHTSGQWMKSYLPLNPAKNDSQGVGAAITYLRRYSLSAIVGVVCDDDDDGETAVGRGNSEQKRKEVEPSKNARFQAPAPRYEETHIEPIEDLGELDLLRGHLQGDQLPTDQLDSYLNKLSKNSGQPVSKIVRRALTKELLGQFKTSYKKELGEQILDALSQEKCMV